MYGFRLIVSEDCTDVTFQGLTSNDLEHLLARLRRLPEPSLPSDRELLKEQIYYMESRFKKVV